MRIFFRKILPLLLFTTVFSINYTVAQDKDEMLRKAIAYYQQLKFDKSLEIFGELVAMDENDPSIRGRRGFVCCQYIKAMDNGQVPRVDDERYRSIVEMGIADLKLALAQDGSNQDNKSCLDLLKRKL